MSRIRSQVYAVHTAFVAWLASASVALAQGGLENPLQTQTVSDFIAGSLKALVVVAMPIITLFIVVAGFMFVFARGNEGKLTKAKENLMHVIIGALLILGAWVIATMIGGTVSQLLR